MSTHNICFRGEIRKIAVLFCWKKCLNWNYGPVVDDVTELVHFPQH